MSISVAQAIALNDCRTDFLGWCAQQGFPDEFVRPAWAFVDAVTTDVDLRVSDTAVRDCFEHAQDQLAAMNQFPDMSLELAAVLLTRNFDTLTEAMMKDKTGILAGLADAPVALEVRQMPDITEINDNINVQAVMLTAADNVPDGSVGPPTPATTDGEPSDEGAAFSSSDSEPRQGSAEMANEQDDPARRRSSRHSQQQNDRSDARCLFMVVSALKRLMSGDCKKYAEPFWDPVDPEADDAPDYYDVIKQPMDLETIKNKYNNKQYTKASKVKADIELMLSNCFTYNDKESDVYELGKKWEVEYRKIWAQYFG